MSIFIWNGLGVSSGRLAGYEDIVYDIAGVYAPEDFLEFFEEYIGLMEPSLRDEVLAGRLPEPIENVIVNKYDDELWEEARNSLR